MHCLWKEGTDPDLTNSFYNLPFIWTVETVAPLLCRCTEAVMGDIARPIVPLLWAVTHGTWQPVLIIFLHLPQNSFFWIRSSCVSSIYQSRSCYFFTRMWMTVSTVSAVPLIHSLTYSKIHTQREKQGVCILERIKWWVEWKRGSNIESIVQSLAILIVFMANAVAKCPL